MFTQCAAAILLASSLSWYGGGDSGALDLSTLPYDETIKLLIQNNIPSEIRDKIQSDFEPEMYQSLIEIAYYRPKPTESADSMLLVYVTDGFGRSEIQLYERPDGAWVLLSRCRDVGASLATSIEQVDFNCDGIDEIMVRNPTGMSGYTQVEVIGILQKKLVSMTKSLFGHELIGRTVSLHKDGGCVTTVEVTKDGLEKFTVGRRITFQLDVSSRAYKLISDVRVSQ